MNQKEIKKFIEENKTSLPLSYHLKLEFKGDDNKTESNKKVTVSDKYNDNSYSIVKFYKPISRF